LQERIAAHCRAQWPRWKFIQARPDRKSTIAEGCQDFTVFLPGGRLLCVETKAKGEKRSPAQLAWAKEMEMLGHKVDVVYSLGQFIALADKAMPKPDGAA